MIARLLFAFVVLAAAFSPALAQPAWLRALPLDGDTEVYTFQLTQSTPA